MLKYPINVRCLSLSNSFRSVPLWLTQQIQVRYRHDVSNIASKNQNTFQNEVNKRRIQAKQSIFIETPANSVDKLTTYCSNIGAKNIYRKDEEQNKNKKNGEKMSYFLVEFNNDNMTNELINTAYHPGNCLLDGKVRVKSRFLTFNPIKNNITKQNKNNVKRDKNIVDQKSIFDLMRKEKTIDSQIMTLYKLNQLSDFSTRLRFLTALQIEEALTGLFHEPKVLPFGSSVNGFGRLQSDLDMVLLSCGNRKKNGPFDVMEIGNSDITRNAVRNNLYVISTLARNWLHGVNNVVPILNARVPIIKYSHDLTNLECDLSMGNISGFQMSELLYTFGEMDARVRPFVFFIRSWAKAFGIIQTFPAQGLSNFMITCLAIFFLQRLPQPVLPPADDFVELHETDENFQSIIDPKKLKFKSKNSCTLSKLLIEFFDYYSSFDFQRDAPSIAVGKIQANIASDSMYIYNPLEYSNVSRNVTDFERNQFIEKCSTAQNVLTQNKIDAVGLLEFYNKKSNDKKLDSFVHNMVNMKNGSNKTDNGTSNKTKTKFSVKTILT